MPIEAPPATKVVPLISGRVKGPLGIGHLPRLWLKLRLGALGKLPEGYRCGEGGSDGQLIEAMGIDVDAMRAYIASEKPYYIPFENWLKKNAQTVTPYNLAEINDGFETFVMPEPRRTDWTTRFGLPRYEVAARLNELDDWDLTHAQIVASDAPATEIVPAISSSVTGPLGVVHLPRLWLKMLLHAHGRLPEGYRYGVGGFDEMTENAVGIAYEPLAAYVASAKPGYLELEAWLRANATSLTPEAIAAHNAKLLAHLVPEERAVVRQAEYGVDGSVKTGWELNDLEDWLAIHKQLLAAG
jgi:hypothetical protein